MRNNAGCSSTNCWPCSMHRASYTEMLQSSRKEKYSANAWSEARLIWATQGHRSIIVTRNTTATSFCIDFFQQPTRNVSIFHDMTVLMVDYKSTNTPCGRLVVAGHSKGVKLSLSHFTTFPRQAPPKKMILLSPLSPFAISQTNGWDCKTKAFCYSCNLLNLIRLWGVDLHHFRTNHFRRLALGANYLIQSSARSKTTF